MSINWGPHFIVPSENLKEFSGIIKLREYLDEDLLREELKDLGISAAVVRINNPWYFRAKGSETWVKIGESEDKQENFQVPWDTGKLKNGPYEVLGIMHAFVKGPKGETAVARQNLVEVTIRN